MEKQYLGITQFIVYQVYEYFQIVSACINTEIFGYIITFYHINSMPVLYYMPATVGRNIFINMLTVVSGIFLIDLNLYSFHLYHFQLLSSI
jgi:hypothetical protein